MDETKVNPTVQDDTQDPAVVAPEVTEGEVVTEAPADAVADSEETQA